MASKILVVDDDPDIREVLTMILESQGYQIVAASDGIECLAMLKAENPDLMIVDLLMPKMDGFALLKELQDGRWSKFRRVPILILSSVREEASRRRYELETALAFNVDDYIEKPINPDVLIERVANLLKKKK
jgi:two-component system alkaline phosphatase synthesis response regulator PhoP